MPKLFAERYFYTNKYYPLDPDEAYWLREQYAARHGKFGAKFIEAVRYFTFLMYINFP